MKKIVYKVALLLSVAFCAFNASAQGLYVVSSEVGLNVRNMPSTNSQVLGRLQDKTQIEVVTFVGNWAQIEYKGRAAYVSSKYIEKIERRSVAEKAHDKKTSAIEHSKTNEGSATKNKDISLRDTNAKENIGVSFVPNGYLGYATFVSSDVSAKGGFGWGVDCAFEVIAKEKIGFIPKNYYGDVSVGYTMRGSYAVPMHYVNFKIRPFGYRYYLPKFNVYGKLGIYVGHPLSYVSTNKNVFASRTDCGLSLAIGAEYDKYGVGILYEQGFVNVCSSSLSLKNTIVCVNISCKLLSSK